MQRDFPAHLMSLRFISFTIFAQRKSLLFSGFFRRANLLTPAQFLLSWWSQLATCNETVVLLSGEGDYLRVIVNVSIGSDGDLAAFNRLKLDPLRIQLPS